MVTFTKTPQKPKRPFVEPGHYRARVVSANEWKVEKKASEEDPEGWCVCLQWRIDDGSPTKEQPVLPQDIPVVRQWQVEQLLAACFEELPEDGEVDVADITGATVCVEVASWKIPEGPAEGRMISFIKRLYKHGTNLDKLRGIEEKPAEVSARPKLKSSKAARKPVAKTVVENDRPQWELDDDNGDGVPF